MTDVKESNELTNKQLQTLLSIKHIRQHLIDVGLINQHGEVILKDECEHAPKHRSRRRHTSKKNVEKFQKTSIHPSSTTANRKHSIENTKNTRKCQRSKSPNNYSIDRQCRNTTISRTSKRSKSQSPTRLSSSNQSTRVKSVLARRTISPKLNPISDRCIVTLIYYGSQTNIPYKRSLFQSEGDEIIVMQQHCGGENIIVYKGALKPNKTFQFESRRHIDYPFALTFYVNGLIDNRLSICCEFRYKHNVRIGGKRGLFGIINVQKSKACKRCRVEQRMKKLAKLKVKNTSMITPILSPDSNLTGTTSPELTITRTISPEEQHESLPHSPNESTEQERTTDSSNTYPPDNHVLEEKLHSSISTLHKNEQNEHPMSENISNNQRRKPIISSEKDSDDKTTIMIE
ncbi:unnamed protein product [Rotaria sordida]|uniref:DUF4590 domain-containing protein n=1 Tax=Rotaria sordida TaxID=392033 RepID=A0A813X6Q6_9BILA|nr:unnamed protein product [Rotaria sordida]CAF3829901.1 unnamed protein product [Rotaria sordida]